MSDAELIQSSLVDASAFAGILIDTFERFSASREVVLAGNWPKISHPRRSSVSERNGRPPEGKGRPSASLGLDGAEGRNLLGRR